MPRLSTKEQVCANSSKSMAVTPYLEQTLLYDYCSFPSVTCFDFPILTSTRSVTIISFCCRGVSSMSSLLAEQKALLSTEAIILHRRGMFTHLLVGTDPLFWDSEFDGANTSCFFAVVSANSTARLQISTALRRSPEAEDILPLKYWRAEGAITFPTSSVTASWIRWLKMVAMSCFE